jgi:hypothetical protein
MDPFWQNNWWLLIVLGCLAIPILGILVSIWTSYLQYRHRRDALEAIRSYTDKGKDPPPELLAALRAGEWYSPPPMSSGQPDVDAHMADAPPWAREFVRAAGDPWRGDSWRGDRYARRAERWAYRSARWRAREPYRRWNAAIVFIALTVGFGYASQVAEPRPASAFLLVAIIMGALAIGSVLTAVLTTVMTTVFRPK